MWGDGWPRALKAENGPQVWTCSPTFHTGAASGISSLYSLTLGEKRQSHLGAATPPKDIDKGSACALGRELPPRKTTHDLSVTHHEHSDQSLSQAWERTELLPRPRPPHRQYFRPLGVGTASRSSRGSRQR